MGDVEPDDVRGDRAEGSGRHPGAAAKVSGRFHRPIKLEQAGGDRDGLWVVVGV